MSEQQSVAYAELSEVLVNRAKARGWQAFQAAEMDCFEQADSFDLVLAWDVMEPVLPVGGLGFRIAVRRALVQALRRVIFKLVAHALMGHRGAVLTPNLVFVARRPR